MGGATVAVAVAIEEAVNIDEYFIALSFTITLKNIIISV